MHCLNTTNEQAAKLINKPDLKYIGEQNV